MSTRFYLPSYSAVAVQPAVDASWERSTGVTYGRPSTVRTGSAMTSFAVSENINNATLDGVCRVYVSDPLSASGTLSGNVKGVIRCQESATAANMRAQLLIKVVSRDGTTVRGTALAHQTAALSGTNEFGTALANRKFPLDWASSPGTALSSVSYSAGDRIVLEIGYRNDTASTTTYTATMSFGDNVGTDLAEDQTSTAANCPWVEFDATLAFENVPYLAGAYVQNGAGATANPSVTVPTPFGGPQAQDDIVVCNVHHESGTTVTGVPTGFVQLGTTQSSGTSEVMASSRFAKRIGVTPDSGSYAFTLSASAWTQITAGIYRNGYELSTVDVAFESLQQANNGATQVTTSANQTTTPTGNNRLAVASCDFFDGGTVTPPSGFATSMTATGVNNYAAFKPLNDTTAQSAQWTLSVADSMVSFLFAMIPRGATLGGGGTTVSISGAAIGGSVAVATLVGLTSLSGASVGGGAAPASISGLLPFSGASVGGSVAPASINGLLPFSGASVGSGVAVASPVGRGAMSGASIGSEVATAAAAGLGTIAGLSLGSGLGVAGLLGTGDLRGVSLGGAIAPVGLVGSGGLRGASIGGGLAIADLSGVLHLSGISGASVGGLVAAATLTGLGSLAGASLGSSANAAYLGGTGELAGVAVLGCVVVGTLTGTPSEPPPPPTGPRYLTLMTLGDGRVLVIQQVLSP